MHIKKDFIGTDLPNLHDPGMILFTQIKIGEIFIYEDFICIKTENIVAFCLQFNWNLHFIGDEFVKIYPNAELILDP